MSDNFDDLTREALSLAWCQFDRDMFTARRKMENFLRTHFEIKKQTPINLSSTPVKVGDLVVVNGEECLVIRKRDQ